MSHNPPQIEQATIFNDQHPPFQPLGELKLKDVGELTEALLLFQQLGSSTRDDPSIQPYLPCPTLLSAMERLIDLHTNKDPIQKTVPLQKPEKVNETKNCTNSGVTSIPSPTTSSTCGGGGGNDFTPKMIQRNAQGGRAWLSKSTPHSRRKRNKYGSTPRKLKHIANLHSDSKTLPKTIVFENHGDDDDPAPFSPVGISATQDQRSQEEDFAFHSQSSLPNAF
jgi:hypothetical protein